MLGLSTDAAEIGCRSGVSRAVAVPRVEYIHIHSHT